MVILVHVGFGGSRSTGNIERLGRAGSDDAIPPVAGALDHPFLRGRAVVRIDLDIGAVSA